MRYLNLTIVLFLFGCEDIIEKNCIDESSIDPNILCPEVWDPVVGCDEQIYSNSCEAEKNGVTFWTKADLD
ncbi:MAG: kazal domain protein [Candidatus Marinimicrobia bacterium]|jgi:hypothetical protein|nr:kazal domain protein [Candidatus Neomarinimicrobiota bacterium]|tara:strand:+ start:712 stop:924 length:213 start_codon:yes stop_codon:yes gene_type:complete